MAAVNLKPAENDAEPASEAANDEGSAGAE
jgi:hypothetical protein